MHTWPQGSKETYNVPTSRQEKLDAIDKLLETQTPEGPRPIGRIKWSEDEIDNLKTGKGLKVFQISVYFVPFFTFSGMQEYGMDTKYSREIKLYYFGKSWKTEIQIRSKMRSIIKQETVKENSNPIIKACFQIDNQLPL